MSGLILSVLFIVFILLGVPIGFGMIISSIIVYVFVTDIPLSGIIGRMFYQVQPFTYSSILYFIVCGTILSRGALAKKLLEISEAFVGWIPNGTPIAAIVGCALFGSITGSSLATLAAIGGIMFPLLINRGWPKAKVGALIGSSSILGMLIPPSVPAVLYALTAEVSVMRLFLAGIGPGILVVLFFSIYIFRVGSRLGIDQEREKLDLLRCIKSLKNGIGALGIPIIIFGGVYGGVFTVTEAAAVAVFYAVLIEIFVYKEIGLKSLIEMIYEGALSSATLIFLILGATVITRIFSLEQIPQKLASQMLNYIGSANGYLFFVNIVILIAGCFLEMASNILLLIPILKVIYPLYNIDPIHFAQMFIFGGFIGYMTPPVGICLFSVTSLFNIPFTHVVREFLPYFLLLIIILVLVTLFPQISIFIPNLIMGTVG